MASAAMPLCGGHRRGAPMAVALAVCAVLLAARGQPREGAERDVRPSVGIVTMHTPGIMSYANSTSLENQRYASRWGYGFHVVDHAVDKSRMPHWSKLLAVQLFLPEYDFVLWIDADAVFFDQSRSIEEVFRIAEWPESQLWAQDIWPDYPSIHLHELIDTGVVLFRNSRWTRNFIIELYHYPPCQNFLNWTEQYCITLAYNDDMLGMQARTTILQTPAVNHHIIPPPESPNDMFIWHLAGRPAKARSTLFSEAHFGRTQIFREGAAYAPFWDFHRLFGRHRYGGLAGLQTCIFGMGPKSLAFMDALLFHFPYMASFTMIRGGAPGLTSAMRATEEVGERYPDRLVHMDLLEYLRGETREGEKFIEGFFCDVFVLGVESWRHLPSLQILSRLARSGLEPYFGDEKKGFGFSALRDAYFVWLYDGCDGGAGAEAAAGGDAAPEARPQDRLDRDDEDGTALPKACRFLAEARQMVESAAAQGAAAGDEEDSSEIVSALWSVHAPGDVGVASALGSTALLRVPRQAFPPNS